MLRVLLVNDTDKPIADLAQALRAAGYEVLPHVAVAARLLTLSLYLGSGESGSRLRRFARGGVGAAVQSRALLALGLLDDPLDLDELPDVLHQARTASTPGVQYAAMFALGMNAADALDDLSTSERLWERTAARWWLAVGPADQCLGRAHPPTGACGEDQAVHQPGNACS